MKTNSSSASRGIMRNLRNPNVYYRVYSRSPAGIILSQINSLHALPSCFCKFLFNIIFESTPTSLKCFFYRFPHKNFARTSLLPHACHMPNQLNLLDFIIRVLLVHEHKS